MTKKLSDLELSLRCTEGIIKDIEDQGNIDLVSKKLNKKFQDIEKTWNEIESIRLMYLNSKERLEKARRHKKKLENEILIAKNKKEITTLFRLLDKVKELQHGTIENSSTNHQIRN